MSTTALTTDGRFPVRRGRPNRPSVDNASRSSWCPHFGDRFMHHGHLLKFEGKSWRLKEAAARVAKRA